MIAYGSVMANTIQEETHIESEGRSFPYACGVVVVRAVQDLSSKWPSYFFQNNFLKTLVSSSLFSIESVQIYTMLS